MYIYLYDQAVWHIVYSITRFISFILVLVIKWVYCLPFFFGHSFCFILSHLLFVFYFLTVLSRRKINVIQYLYNFLHSKVKNQILSSCIKDSSYYTTEIKYKNKSFKILKIYKSIFIWPTNFIDFIKSMTGSQ